MLRHAMKNVVAALLVLCVAAGAAYGASLQAKMTKVKGDVQMQKGGAGAWVKVKEGDTAGKGTSIKTGMSAEVFVSWGGGNSVKVKEMSQITLDKLMKDGAGVSSSLNLNKGKVFAKAGKMSGGATFEIKTPTALAGVRGTGFELGENSLAVVEGSVSMKVGGEEIIVDEGSMIEVINGMLGEIEMIPPAELEELNETLEEANKVVEDVAGALDELDAEATGKGAVEGEDVSSDEVFNDVMDAIDTAVDQNILNDITEAAGNDPGMSCCYYP